jgi:hypothetical protein
MKDYSKVKKLGWVVLDPEKEIYIKYVCGNFLIIDFEGTFTIKDVTLELFVLIEQRFNFRKMEQVCRFGIDNKFVQGIINSL